MIHIASNYGGEYPGDICPGANVRFRATQVDTMRRNVDLSRSKQAYSLSWIRFHFTAAL